MKCSSFRSYVSLNVIIFQYANVPTYISKLVNHLSDFLHCSMLNKKYNWSLCGVLEYSVTYIDQWVISTTNNSEVWADVHYMTMTLSPESFVSKGYKYNPNVVPPSFRLLPSPMVCHYQCNGCRILTCTSLHVYLTLYKYSNGVCMWILKCVPYRTFVGSLLDL